MIKPAIITKGFLLIFLITLVIFGTSWMLALILIESYKLIAIYSLWQMFKDEEKVRGVREQIKMARLYTVVSDLAEIQYINEIRNLRV